MKVLAVVFLAAMVTAAPREKGEDKGMIQIMVQCLAENWKHGKVGDCITCFKDLEKVKNPEDGLAMGKKCVADYLPRANKDCTTEISALVPTKEPKEVMECFEKSLITMSTENCLEKAGQNDDILDTFTEGAFCMVEGAKNATKFIKKSLGIKGGGKMKRMIMRLMIKAHCDNANDDNDKKKSCNECFRDAMKSGKRRGKLGVVGALKDCSENHLGEAYTECTNLVRKKGKGQGKLIKKCYSKKLIRAVVESCDKGATKADVETFMKILDCGKEKVKTWVKNNANPKMAEKLMEFLDD